MQKGHLGMREGGQRRYHVLIWKSADGQTDRQTGIEWGVWLVLRDSSCSGLSIDKLSTSHCNLETIPERAALSYNISLNPHFLSSRSFCRSPPRFNLSFSFQSDCVYSFIILFYHLFSTPASSCSESQGSWKLSQLSLCKRWGTLWTGRKFIRGLHRDKWDKQIWPRKAPDRTASQMSSCC